MTLRALLVLCALVVACGGDDAPDATSDTGSDADTGADADTGLPPVDVVFAAEPDPAEPTGCADTPPASGEVRAKHVECTAELATGHLAMGRIGDIVIENERVRFIVRTGTESASTIGAPPGGLVDAVRGDRPDALKEVFPLFDFASMDVTALEIVDAGVTSGEARVRVLFDDAPIQIIDTVAPGLSRGGRVRGQLDYVLSADSDALSIEVGITTRPGVPTARLTPGLLALLGGQELVEPGYGVVGDGSPGGTGGALVGERETDALAFSFSDEVGVSRVETISLITTSAAVSVVTGEVTRFDARVSPGETAAEAYANTVSPSDDGSVHIMGPPGERVEIVDEVGNVWLRTRLAEAGSARFPLPAGSYVARTGFRGFFPGADVPIDHTTDDTPVTVSAAPSGTLTIRATADGDASAPVRVLLMQAGSEVERYVAIGPTDRRVPPGDYEVHVSRGLEHDVFAFAVTVSDGETVALDPVLPRAIDTDGWVSVDLHLHTELSTDSLHPVGEAVQRLAAEGLDAASSTDHDFITDYPAIASDVGVADYLVLVRGAEVSTTAFGHFGGYPLSRDASRAGYGAPKWFDLSPTEVFAAIRAQGDAALGGALVQLNHPRLGDASFFGAVGLDLDTGRATASPMDLGLDPATDLDDFGFDVVEVWNGYTRGGNEESFEDYLALRAAGRSFTMVGNSDSHLTTLAAGLPRTFVRVPDDTRGAFGWSDIATSLRAGDATVSGGIFVTATPTGPPVGDTLMVQVHVEAAPWVEVDRLRIYAGRTVAVDRTVTATSDAVRVDEIIDVPLSGADFVVVRADGMGEPDPYQHFAPFGVTNPIDVP